MLIGNKDSYIADLNMKIVTGVKYRSPAMTNGFDPYLMIGPISNTATSGSSSISAEFYDVDSLGHGSGATSYRIDSLVKNTRNRNVIGMG